MGIIANYIQLAKANGLSEEDATKMCNYIRKITTIHFKKKYSTKKIEPTLEVTSYYNDIFLKCMEFVLVLGKRWDEIDLTVPASYQIPGEYQKYVEEKRSMENIKLKATNKRRCFKCGSNNVREDLMQTRSCDEDSTQMLICNDCGAKKKI